MITAPVNVTLRKKMQQFGLAAPQGSLIKVLGGTCATIHTTRMSIESCSNRCKRNTKLAQSKSPEILLFYFFCFSRCFSFLVHFLFFSMFFGFWSKVLFFRCFFFVFLVQFFSRFFGFYCKFFVFFIFLGFYFKSF